MLSEGGKEKRLLIFVLVTDVVQRFLYCSAFSSARGDKDRGLIKERHTG